MRLRVAHASLQFSDTNKQQTADVEAIFDRAVSRNLAWLTGTEAGPGAGNTGRELVRIGRAHGYKLWVPSHQANGGAAQHTDCWIAVRQDLVGSGWKRGYEHVFNGSGQVGKDIEIPRGMRWGPKGLVHVEFNSSVPELGHISIGAAHYLTHARDPKSVFWDMNEKLTDEIAKWARRQGAGSGLVFYGGDQNMDDSKNKQPQGDTFMGAPLTSVWDEINKWPNTGAGTIDVMATYDKDRRVSVVNAFALNDRKFRLHADHFFIEAVVRVAPKKV